MSSSGAREYSANYTPWLAKQKSQMKPPTKTEDVITNCLGQAITQWQMSVEQ